MRAWMLVVAALLTVGGCTLLIGVDPGHDRPAAAGGGTPGSTGSTTLTSSTGTGGMATTSGSTSTGGMATTSSATSTGGIGGSGGNSGCTPGAMVPCSTNVSSAVSNAGVTNGVATDLNGNIFLTGSFNPAITFGNDMLTTAGAGDLFLAKLTAMGMPVWAHSYGSSADETQSTIAATVDGGVVFAGVLSNDIALGECGTLSSLGVSVAKFDAGGTCKWAKSFGVSSFTGLVVTADGGFVITGTINGSVALGGAPLPDKGDAAFLAKFDASTGAPIWSSNYRILYGPVEIKGIATNSSNGIYLSGAVLGNGVTFENVTNLNYGMLLGIFDTNGNPSKIQSFGPMFGAATSVGIAVDPNFNVLLSGSLSGNVQLGAKVTLTTPATDSAWWFMAQFDPSGNATWGKLFGDPGFHYGASSLNIAVDAQGNVILTGAGQGTMNFGGAPLTMNGTDAVLAKFDSTGAHLWSNRFGDAKNQAGVAVSTVFGSNRIVMAGNAAGQIDFGKGPVVCAGNDVFVATFDP
jgi:hypothetical protein